MKFITTRPVLFALLAALTIVSCKKTYRPDSEPAPAIALISPLSDSVGKKVIIEGKNFLPGPTVTFNGIPATVEWSNNEEIHFRIPQNASSGKITVSSGGVVMTYPVDFTIKSGARQFYTDAEGGMVGGRIAVNVLGGTLYDKTPVVKFNDIVAETYKTGSTLAIAIIPKGATSGKISLTVDGKTYVNNFTVVGGSYSTYISSAVSSVNFDAAGDLYDVSENKVIKYNAGGGSTTIATIGNNYTTLSNCVIDKMGNIYVASPSDRDPIPPSRYHFQMPVYSSDNSIIYKISPSGSVSKFAGIGVRGTLDGPGTAAQFDAPTYLSLDNNGNLIVSDGALLRKVSPAGVVSTIAGNLSNTQAVTIDGKGTAASFSYPGSSTVDAAGNIYVLDAQTKLRKITPAGEVSTIRFLPSDGNPFGGVTYLLGLAFHPSGDLYFNCSGAVYVLKKNDLQSGTGVIYNTYLNPMPKLGSGEGIAIDGTGRIYISGAEDLKTGKTVKVTL